jgi:hypothetical protein
MDRRFEAREWAALTYSEKARRCQLMADAAMQLANEASSRLVSEDYRRLAEQWLKLATDLLNEAQASLRS